MSDKTVYLKDYKAPEFAIENVDLSFDLYDDHALVCSKLKLMRAAPGDLVLHGEDLELISVHMNSVKLNTHDYNLTKTGLQIPNCPDAFTLEIVTKIKPQENTHLSGLYRSNHLFCTQCEAEGFRRITYFLDRPDVLTKYTTKITADKKQYPTLLSNGNLLEKGDAPDGRHWVLWQDPFKKPSYLFALVAGDLVRIEDTFTTMSGRKVDLHIYVEKGNEDKCAHAMTSLKKAMRWDEEVYGREYDLELFMIVAVSDFNMGAMENKGLNIFNSKYILARPDSATDLDFADIEGVVGHEYFHNWTGNRVTCRDWFQLSLKEGLTVFRDQEFSRDMNSRDVNRIMDVKALLVSQFPEDAGSMAHPVRPESYQQINNFYTATIYNKGAEVIRMQHTLLGAEGFRKGMDLYFDRHDGQAVTIDDFVAAMEDANNVDFSQLKRWYSQSGTPEVEMESEFTDGRLTIDLKQYCPPTADCKDKKPFAIPIRIALFNADGSKIALENDLLQLTQAEQSFSFEGLQEQPIISLLSDFSAPIKMKTKQSDKELEFLLQYETNGYSKWEAAQSLVFRYLNQCLQKPSSEWEAPDSLIQAFRYVLLDDSLDADLRAELLTPPGFEEYAATLKIVDPTAIEAVRDFYRQELGSGLYPHLLAQYKRLWAEEDHGMHGKAYGRRKLRNLCLHLMMKANEEETLSLCQQQFTQAKTMTDQIASFALLVNASDKAIKMQAIDAFYKQWSKDELVLDKWFAIQAFCDAPDTLVHVQQLLKHAAFSIKNPNKVRSLLGAFCSNNPRNFHAIDGAGYAFLSKMVLELDAINPQIAARLATPFTRWQRLDKKRQELMVAQIKVLAAKELSSDLRELVDKSLAS